MKRLLLLVFVVLAGVSGVRADEEVANSPRVVADQFGRCYAKSVPVEGYGSKGTTSVYLVQKREDKLLYTLPSYASELYIACNVGRPQERVGTSLVQSGPWARGHKPSSNDLAITFYFEDKLVRRYSTLDIAGSTGKASVSVSHYRVIDKILGYRWREGNFYVFEIVTMDGRTLTFDPTTGEIIKRK